MGSSVFYLDSEPDFVAPDIPLADEAFKEINKSAQRISESLSSTLKNNVGNILLTIQQHNDMFKKVVISLEADLMNEAIDAYSDRLKDLKFALSDLKINQDEKELIETDIESIMDIVDKRLNAVEEILFKEHRKQQEQMAQIQKAEKDLRKETGNINKSSKVKKDKIPYKEYEKDFQSIQKASEIYKMEYDKFTHALSFFRNNLADMRKKNDSTVSEYETLFKDMLKYLGKIKEKEILN